MFWFLENLASRETTQKKKGQVRSFYGADVCLGKTDLQKSCAGLSLDKIRTIASNQIQTNLCYDKCCFQDDDKVICLSVAKYAHSNTIFGTQINLQGVRLKESIKDRYHLVEMPLWKVTHGKNPFFPPGRKKFFNI